MRRIPSDRRWTSRGFSAPVYIAALLALATSLSPHVRAAVFITSPWGGVTCSGGSPCSITWDDDGEAPLLNAVGPSSLALYQGTDTLVQQITPNIDVSQTRELSFTPSPNAGPNSNSYFIKLASLSAHDPNDTSLPYTSFSGFFTLDHMSGTAQSPIASLTSALSSAPASVSVQSFSSNGIVSTSVGTLSSLSSVSVPASASGSGSSSSGVGATGSAATLSSNSGSGTATLSTSRTSGTSNSASASASSHSSAGRLHARPSMAALGAGVGALVLGFLLV